MRRHTGTARIAALAGAVFIIGVPAWGQRVAEESFFSGIVGSGARALGMGGAFIAVADDATAAAWNPAGLCVLETPEAALVGQPIVNLNYSYSPYTFTSGSQLTSPFRSSLERTDQRGAPIDFNDDFATTARTSNASVTGTFTRDATNGVRLQRLYMSAVVRF